MKLSIKKRLEQIILKQHCYNFQNWYCPHAMNVSKAFDDMWDDRPSRYQTYVKY